MIAVITTACPLHLSPRLHVVTRHSRYSIHVLPPLCTFCATSASSSPSPANVDPMFAIVFTFFVVSTRHRIRSSLVSHHLKSSSSGAVFLKKVGCHDSPLLPILSQSHEVFVSHSRPFCDVCHPLRSWPSSAYFPLQSTLQQQPMDVVTSDHVTNLLFSFLYCSSIISRTYSVVLFSLQDIFIIFPYADISNDCNCSCFW